MKLTVSWTLNKADQQQIYIAHIVFILHNTYRIWSGFQNPFGKGTQIVVTVNNYE